MIIDYFIKDRYFLVTTQDMPVETFFALIFNNQ